GRLQMTVDEVAAICDEAHKIGLRVVAHVESTEGVRVALQGGVDTIEHGSEMDDEIIRLYKNYGQRKSNSNTSCHKNQRGG
ncbi:amidohydrolase family protein, partial [Paenibacillus sp.]